MEAFSWNEYKCLCVIVFLYISLQFVFHVIDFVAGSMEQTGNSQIIRPPSQLKVFPYYFPLSVVFNKRLIPIVEKCLGIINATEIGVLYPNMQWAYTVNAYATSRRTRHLCERFPASHHAPSQHGGNTIYLEDVKISYKTGSDNNLRTRQLDNHKKPKSKNNLLCFQ